jgi:acetyl-CoA carboxylase biotin carboxyl carrier protein
VSDRPQSADALEPLLAAVDLLAPSFEASGLDEIEVEVGELGVRLARPRAVPAAPPVTAATAAGVVSAASTQETPAVEAPESASGMRFVHAPLTGIWYAAPSPGARPYIKEGDEVVVGQVVGLIEAMKLFNEIKSDVAGTAIRMLVDSGTLVKRQQPIVEVDPS